MGWRFRRGRRPGALTIGNGHDLRSLAPLRLSYGGSSLLGGGEAPVDKRFLQIQLAFVEECLGEDLEDGPQHARVDPLLKPAVACLIRRLPVWQVGPRNAGPQDPQNAIEHSTVLPPRAPSTVVSARQLGQEGPNEDPLPVGEVTWMRRIEKGHPARMAPRYTAIDADDPLAAATALVASNSPEALGHRA